MVFASICEHASTAYFFASTSSDQICLESSEHFRKYNWRTANSSINFHLILHVGLLGWPSSFAIRRSFHVPENLKLRKLQ